MYSTVLILIVVCGKSLFNYTGIHTEYCNYLCHMLCKHMAQIVLLLLVLLLLVLLLLCFSAWPSSPITYH